MWGTILSQNSPQSSCGPRLFSFGIDVVSLLSGRSASFLRSTCYYFPVIKVVKSVIRWKSNQWHDMTRWHLYWIEWIKWVAGDVTVFLRHAWDDADIFQSTFFTSFCWSIYQELHYLPSISWSRVEMKALTGHCPIELKLGCLLLDWNIVRQKTNALVMSLALRGHEPIFESFQIGSRVTIFWKSL